MKIAYKNIGTVTKEFYGVKFNPGDTKLVDGYINAPSLIRVDASDSRKAKNLTTFTAKSEAKPGPKPDPKSDSKKEETTLDASTTK